MRTWTFIRREGDKETKEEVKLENWIWGVVYDDGTELHQFDDKGIFHQIKEIDQARARLWVLYQPKGIGNGRIDIVIPEDKEVALIHKYKVYGTKGSGKDVEYRIVCFGYKIKGQAPHYNFIMPNGTIVQSSGEQNPRLSLMLK